MSAPTKDLVQVTETAAVGKLPPEIQAQLELRKLSNQVAGKLAEMNWGKELDHATRRAIADWGRQFRVDVTTEINVLGGNIYLNSHFYLRQLAEMVEAGLVEYAYADHVEDDARLEKLGTEGEGERSRRLRQRIMYQVPDKAASAVVFRVKLRSMDREVVGVKWCGNGTRTRDPVGDQFPVETSESRAARRAMRLLTSHVPKHVAEETIAIEDAADVVSDRIRAGQHTFREREAELNRPAPSMALPAAGDPYGPVATVPSPAKEPVNNSPKKDDTPASNTIDLMAALKTSLAGRFEEIAASINKLLKDPRVKPEDRERFTAAAANATTAADLERVMGEIENAITGEGGLGL